MCPEERRQRREKGRSGNRQDLPGLTGGKDLKGVEYELFLGLLFGSSVGGGFGRSHGRR